MLTEDLLIEQGLELYRRNLAARKPTGPLNDRAMYCEIVDRRKDGNPTHVVYCNECHTYHPIFSDNHNHLTDAIADFREKHLAHGPVEVSSIPIWSKQGWQSNADVKEAFQAEQTATTTNLQSLASSATAGWGSASVDNSSNLYLDAIIMWHIAAVNTAPGSDQRVYIFAYGSTDAAIFTSTGTSGGTVGTEGTLTFPSISTLAIVMPQVGQLPYPVQNKALDGGPFSIASAFRGILPQTWGQACLNFTGFTFASSGNTVKFKGVYNTVV